MWQRLSTQIAIQQVKILVDTLLFTQSDGNQENFLCPEAFLRGLLGIHNVVNLLYPGVTGYRFGLILLIEFSTDFYPDRNEGLCMYLIKTEETAFKCFE